MTIDTTAPRTRRALLAGGLGGLAALAANAIARPGAASAVDGQTIVVGGEYDSTSLTAVTNASGDGLLGASFGSGIGVRGESTSGIGVRGAGSSFGVYGVGGGTGFGVHGANTSGTAVNGVSTSGTGVQGSSTSGRGIQGLSEQSSGVVGQSSSGTDAAVIGHTTSGVTGVLGYSGTIPFPNAKPKTGVYGHAEQDSSSRGVWGYSPAGQGVRGEATSGRGVQGQATSGVAMRAAATSGIGLWASTSTGHALLTDGRVRFDKSAGQATIALSTASVTVTPGIDLTATSAVIATLNGNAGGSTAIKRVAINTAANTFTIYLTANTTASVKVAWLVLG